MKQFSKKLFALVVLLSATNVMLYGDCCDNDCDNDGDRVVPFIQFRSQGRDTARKLYGTTSYAVYQPDMDGWYGTFNMTLQYDRSFRNSRIAHCLFGDSLVNNVESTNNCDNDCGDSTLLIAGLELGDDRPEIAWVAENFYLPRDFASAITFSPRVQDVLLDLNLFVGFDRWVNGLYFRLYGPVVWNKTSLRPCERIIEEGTEDNGRYTAGFFAPDVVETEDLFSRALQFFGGCTPPTVEDITLQPLRFAKFTRCNLPNTNTNNNNCDNDCDNDCGSSFHKTGFAELRGEFGWNYIAERYRFLINIQAAAPTGSRPNAEFLFPAQVGNGKHWELGGGLGASWMMWGSEDGEKSFNFIVEADITHLFNAKQTRTFDLKGKPMSRYLLAEKMAPTADFEPDVQLAANSSAFQFAGEYAPVANITTRKVKVSIGAQGDVVAMFNYTCRGFSWDLGYNFWGMSSSKIHINCDEDDCPETCPTIIPFTPNTWALKGDASVFGYPTPATDPATAVPLGATESKVTIFNGTNNDAFNPPTVPNTLTNPAIDPVVTPAVTAGGDALFAFSDPTTPLAAINTSVPPVFISADDFDFDGAKQRGLSHKVFTHFSYTWLNHDRWLPYLGAGFSAEFGSGGHGRDCDNDDLTTTNIDNCPSSVSCALSKWAVEIKGGVSFH